MALVQLIFQRLAINTHFQRKALCLTPVPSLFITMFSCLLLIFHFRLTRVTSCLCYLPSAMLDWLLWLIFLAGPSSPTHIPLPPPGLSLCSSDCFSLQLFLHAVLLPRNSHSGSLPKPHHNPCTSVRTLTHCFLLWMGLLLCSGLQPPLVYTHSFNSPHFSPLTVIQFFHSSSNLSLSLLNWPWCELCVCLILIV